MARATRFLASAAVGSLMVVGASGAANAQSGSPSAAAPIVRVASSAPGSILGVVRDDQGMPMPGVLVSALGTTTTVAVSDKSGRFEFGILAPGPYLVRAHLPGFVAPRASMLQVNPSGQATSTITLRRAGIQILAAGMGAADPEALEIAEPSDTDEPADTTEHDHSETSWRIRHARRGILKDVAIPGEWQQPDGWDNGGGLALLTRTVGSQARAATSFFTDTPFSGQVNLLTTGSFDTREQLFATDSLMQNVAYARLGAPVGERADWTVRGALTQADISSWIVAGSYAVRAPARHRYDVGLSYSTQRYDGGNVLALRDVTDGSRNVGTLYGYDSFVFTPAVTLSYGSAYAHYDYLQSRSLLSPRAELTVSPVAGLRFTGAVSRRALAPGAEEFLPPADSGIWLPPQRTFSSLDTGRPFAAERTTNAQVAVERDFGASTVAVKAFRQRVDDQLLTVFGADLPGQPAAKIGHYLVGTAGDVEARGYVATIRTVLASRVHGSVEYSVARALMTPATPAGDSRYLVLMASSLARPTAERIHDLSTSIETNVPETATRVLVLYRLSDAFARPNGGADSGTPFDARFDVQIRQSLPFMNFTSANWEMLLAVRNFFREASPDQSVYDEAMVVRPPKRVVGGVTLRF